MLGVAVRLVVQAARVAARFRRSFRAARLGDLSDVRDAFRGRFRFDAPVSGSARVRGGGGGGVVSTTLQVRPVIERLTWTERDQDGNRVQRSETVDVTSLAMRHLARALTQQGIPRLRRAVPRQTGELRGSIGGAVRGKRAFVIGSGAPYADHVRYRRNDRYGAYRVRGTLDAWAAAWGGPAIRRARAYAARQARNLVPPARP